MTHNYINIYITNLQRYSLASIYFESEYDKNQQTLIKYKIIYDYYFDVICINFRNNNNNNMYTSVYEINKSSMQLL